MPSLSPTVSKAVKRMHCSAHEWSAEMVEEIYNSKERDQTQCTSPRICSK